MAKLLNRISRFKYLCGLLLWVYLALFISSCSVSEWLPAQELLLDTPTLTQTTTSTPTIVWFPPTATRTPLPPTLPVFPTQDKRPGLGEMILEDDFSRHDRWQTWRVNAGSSAYGLSELTLAAAQPRVTLTSFYLDAFPNDYYLEITAKTSLCRGQDVYGIILRAASGQDFYRFMVNCQGEIRVDWVKGGSVVILQDWTRSGQVPPGAPLSLKLGVWMYEDQMNLFINDVYQVGFGKLFLRSGNLGLFIRAAGDTAMTVSFSDLVVKSIGVVPPTPVPTPTLTPAQVSRTPAPVLPTRPFKSTAVPEEPSD